MTHTVMATFQVRNGRISELCALLDRHHAVITAAGYGDGPAPIRLIRRTDAGPVLIEIFDWVDGGVAKAALDQSVIAIWRGIDALCEARGGGPAADFPAVERMSVGLPNAG